jgi:hypothetical protein
VRKETKTKNPPRLTRADRFLLVMARREIAAVRQNDRVRIRGERLFLTAAEAGEIVARDLAAWKTEDGFVLTDSGRAWARRQAAVADPYREQHGDVSFSDGVTIDLSESPLLWLHRRRGADGNTLIGDAAFAAGERLRADFTFGNMSPRVTLNWSAAVQGSRNPHGADPSDSALAARQRVRRALDRVGPELSGILLDVCCFLKRLEDVERDRKWPARSAKIILSLALARLARHYGYSDCAEGQMVRKAS